MTLLFIKLLLGHFYFVCVDILHTVTHLLSFEVLILNSYLISFHLILFRTLGIYDDVINIALKKRHKIKTFS